MFAEFEVVVSKSEFKFNCAHFIAYKGFRERLHGHNYSLSVKIVGTDTVNEDGYVIDFGDVKKAVKALCNSINEYFICPMRSDVLDIAEENNQICLVCEDGSKFSFPSNDCILLPLVHSSAEELAHWFWCCIIRFVNLYFFYISIWLFLNRKIGLEKLLARNLKTMEVSVAEAPMQFATFRSAIPKDEAELSSIELRSLNRKPQSCFGDD